MKLRIVLPMIASLAILAAIPVSANGLVGARSNPPSAQSSSGDKLAAAPKTKAEWEMYCRGIKNRPHRQACFGEHGIARRI
ncbi:MAG: hypothetical protein ACHQAY_17095 [Hyphomicrobiales bacterium]